MGYNRSYYDNIESIEKFENTKEYTIYGLTSRQLKLFLNKEAKND
jgi:hypothetical protein